MVNAPSFPDKPSTAVITSNERHLNVNAYRQNYDAIFRKNESASSKENTAITVVERPAVAYVAPTAQEYRERARAALRASQTLSEYISETELPVTRRARLMMDRDYLLFLVEAN